MVVLSCVASVTGACAEGGGSRTGASQGPEVVTTVAPITSIVAAVAGDLAQVRGVVPEGVNSHTFEPPPSTAKVLASAGVVFLNGLKLEEPTKELARGG